MRRLIAEAIGTFILVFAGTGAIVLNDLSHGAVTHAGVSLTFGAAVSLIIVLFGTISGAHVNPAVTIGLFVAGRFPGKHIFLYVMSQCVGAILASRFLLYLFPHHATLGATIPIGDVWLSFVLEFYMTFLLMFIILRINALSNASIFFVALSVGTVVGLEAFFGGPISGASMNPARSFAPALISGIMEHLWVYLLAPVLGSITAAAVCRCTDTGHCCGKVAYE